MTGLNEVQLMEYDNLRRAPKRIPAEFLQQGRRHRRKSKGWHETRGLYQLLDNISEKSDNTTDTLCEYCFIVYRKNTLNA
jgi:hypothetical protein